MPPSLWKSSLRYLVRHPWLMALSVLGVALGVAVVVSIDLANTSAARAFSLSAESVAGRATHQITGAGEGLDADVYRRLRVEAGYRRSAPVVQGYAAAQSDGTQDDAAADTVGASGRTFQVLGVDPFAEGPFRPYVGGGAGGVDLGAFMAEPMTALMAAGTADEMGLAVGDTLRLGIEGVPAQLRLVGLLEPEGERSRRALENLLVTDVATAQALFDAEGKLSRIDLILPEGEAEREAALRQIQGVLPTGATVERAEARTQTLEQMTRAFELNLTALSLLALIVGAFLIYNTMTSSVVQRRPLIGRLRALGVTRREIFSLVLGESLLIGLAGTVIGLLLGIVLARGLVLLITQTINDLYFVVTVRELDIAPWSLAKGAALGLGTTALAALAPAREATQAAVSTVLQRSQQESGARRLVPRLAGAGVVVGLAAVGLLWVPGRSIWIGYAALFLVLMAAALLTPVAVVGFAKILRPVMGRLFGVLGRMAARGVVSTLSRTAVAIAALTVAVAATVGVGVMVDSFRQTVQVWLGHALQADVYVQPPSLVFRRSDATLKPGVAERLRVVEGVEGSYTVRRVSVDAQEAGRTELVAIDLGPNTPDTYRFKAGDEVQVWQRFAEEDIAIVSEPYSFRTGLGVGDTLRVQTDRGVRALPIHGVFYDYASDLGVATVSRTTYDRYYDDRAVSGIAFTAASSVPVDTLVQRLRTAAGGEQELLIRSTRALREASLEVFDRTFTITTVLRLLAVVVAFIGVLSALMALALEKSRELAVLRAGGMTPGQVWRYVTMQTGVMGLVAGVLAVPLGLALATVLVFVINKRSFGWTLQFAVAPEILVQALLLAFVAAVLAGLYPSYKMARANPAMALREE